MRQMAGSDGRFKAPVWGDGCKRLDNEAASACGGMRYPEFPRAPFAAAPVDNVEIDHAGAPATAPAASKFSLNCLQLLKHVGRIEIAFHQCNRIGEIAAGATMRLVKQDRRGIEKAKVVVEAGDCCLDDLRRPPEPPVRTVRPDRDDIEVRCA